MTTSTTPTNTSTTGFLDLSPELRNDIYDLALVQPSPIEVSADFSFYVGAKLRFRFCNLSPLPLFRTCRQIYNEATTVFYGYNTFAFFGAQELSMFIRSLIPNNICHLRYVDVYGRDSVSSLVPHLLHAKNLEILRLRLPDSHAPEDALDFALALKPLAETIYRNQTVKDKQKVLATICFADRANGDAEETERSIRFETAVGGHLYDVLYAETMFVKLEVNPRTLRALWQARNLVEEYPSIRKALVNGFAAVTGDKGEDSNGEDEGEEEPQLDDGGDDTDDESKPTEDSSEDESSSEEASDD